jgi:hypothetical protein
MSQFAWVSGRKWPVAADVAAAALNEIAGKNDGALRPSAVVEESRPEDAPLHPCFEWDDSKAAELYRQDQAAKLIRSVRVIQSDEEDEEPIRVFIRVEDDEGKSNYLPAAQVMSDEELRQEAIADALDYLDRARRKIEQFRDLERFHAQIASVSDGLVEAQAAARRKRQSKAA